MVSKNLGVPTSKRIIFPIIGLLFVFTNLWECIHIETFLPNIVDNHSLAQHRHRRSSVLSPEEQTLEVPVDPRIHFIHIGKAGGITFEGSLGLHRKIGEVKCNVRNKDGTNKCCVNKARDSQLFNHRIGKYHMWGGNYNKEEKEWMLNNSNVFLYTVRHPIDRLISTYNYHRQEYSNATQFAGFAKFHHECFPSGMDHMISTLQKSNDTERSCIDLGKKVLTAQIRSGGSHFQLGYDFYYKYTYATYANHSVAVLRTEHMWDDIINLDRLLGGSGNFSMAGHKHSHGSGNYTVPYDSKLSEPNTIYLCCLIYKEIHVYQEMILKAFNLNASQKKASLTDLHYRCHISMIYHWMHHILGMTSEVQLLARVS